MYEIRPVVSKADWSHFIELPWTIYKNDQLDLKKNPFFKHASMYPLVAFQNGKCVGRIVGVIDENLNRFHEEKTALFGFYESINDPKLARQLLDQVAEWAKKNGMNTLRGPVNLSTNHECGLLVEGFQDPPSVMMNYNPPYYADLFEKCGFEKAKDLFAYRLTKDSTKLSDRLLAHAERIKKRGSITFRTVRMSEFDQEVDRILEVYNDAWEKNWGFVPMEPEEFRHMAKDMKMILDPELCLIAEVRGKIAGFALTLPDVNQAIKTVKDGKLLPTGLFKLLWNAKGPGRKKTINRIRIITLGIKKAYQELGIGPLLYTEYTTRGKAFGYSSGEASWILEDNKPMNKALEQMCGERYKVYRIYDRPLRVQ
jgi:GNAT superfamily N-acetyltransferase